MPLSISDVLRGTQGRPCSPPSHLSHQKVECGAQHAKKWTNRRWRCHCDIPWHECAIHLSCPKHTNKKRGTEIQTGPKTKVAMTSHQADSTLKNLEGPMLASELCLGPKLATRFAHLTSVSPANLSQSRTDTQRPHPNLTNHVIHPTSPIFVNQTSILPVSLLPPLDLALPLTLTTTFNRRAPL